MRVFVECVLSCLRRTSKFYAALLKRGGDAAGGEEEFAVLGDELEPDVRPSSFRWAALCDAIVFS